MRLHKYGHFIEKLLNLCRACILLRKNVCKKNNKYTIEHLLGVDYTLICNIEWNA